MLALLCISCASSALIKGPSVRSFCVVVRPCEGGCLERCSCHSNCGPESQDISDSAHGSRWSSGQRSRMRLAAHRLSDDLPRTPQWTPGYHCRFCCTFGFHSTRLDHTVRYPRTSYGPSHFTDNIRQPGTYQGPSMLLSPSY